jgi:hypothetical protein
MGVVYRARQTELNRLVALKVMLAGLHAGSQGLARFRTEAEAVARLQHPNIVQVYEVGEYQGHPFFSLELVEGGCLADRLDGTPLAPRRAAELVHTLARAVHVIHQRGVIHRDLKPGNVLLTADGVPKVTDFGLAKFLDAEVGQTQSGAILGTPSYMAPEQAAGGTRGVGPATDIYALGAILYELLTGRPPFRGPTPLDTVLQVVSDEPVAPRRLQRKVPRDLETICLKCLDKNPSRRYPSAEELANELNRFLRGEPVRVQRPSMFTLAWYWLRRPERMRAAGLIQFWMAMFSATYSFVWLAGLSTADLDRTLVNGTIGGLWLALGALGVWVGLRTIAGRLWAILVGSAISLFVLYAELAPMLGWKDSGVRAVNIVRTLSVLLLPVLLHCFALIAYVVNRESVSGRSNVIGRR